MQITINQKQYEMVFNFGVLKEVKNECKCATPQILERISKGDLEIIESIIKHGVLFNHEDFDTKEVLKMSLAEVFDSFTIIGKLLNESMPKGTTDEKKKK